MYFPPRFVDLIDLSCHSAYITQHTIITLLCMIKHNVSTKNIRVSARDKTNWADAGAPYLMISPRIVVVYRNLSGHSSYCSNQSGTTTPCSQMYKCITLQHGVIGY